MTDEKCCTCRDGERAGVLVDWVRRTENHPYLDCPFHGMSVEHSA